MIRDFLRRRGLEVHHIVIAAGLGIYSGYYIFDAPLRHIAEQKKKHSSESDTKKWKAE